MNQGFGLSAPDSSALDPSARPSSCRAGSSAVISLTRLLAPRPCVMPHCGFEENFLVGSRARFGRCCSCGAALSASAHVREGRVGGCRVVQHRRAPHHRRRRPHAQQAQAFCRLHQPAVAVAVDVRRAAGLSPAKCSLPCLCVSFHVGRNRLAITADFRVHPRFHSLRL